MSEQGAALQVYNQELVKGIEALKRKRSDLMQLIADDEHQKEQLEAQLSVLNDKLTVVNKSLTQKLYMKAKFDKSIETTEAAYMKILESSQTLLSVVRQETLSADQPENSKERSTLLITALDSSSISKSFDQ